MFAHDHKQRSGERDLTPSCQCADRHGSQPGSRTEGPNGAIRTAPPSSSSSPPPSEITSLSGFLVEAGAEAARAGSPQAAAGGRGLWAVPFGEEVWVGLELACTGCWVRTFSSPTTAARERDGAGGVVVTP